MPVNLSIKNVPDRLADKLRAAAVQNHRSLQKELMSILERAVGAENVAEARFAVLPGRRDVPTLDVEEVARRAGRLFPDGTPSSVPMIRAMRDSRCLDAPPAARSRRP